MNKCTLCESDLEISGFRCVCCETQISGSFPLPRLARLGPAEQSMLEDFLITGGNISELAQQHGVSRPTMRNRLQDLIGVVSRLRDADTRRIDEILVAIEKKQMSPELGGRLIRELQHGSN